MKRLSALLFSLVLSVILLAQTKSPRLATVTPDTGNSSVSYTAAGENLTKDSIKDLYITNGKDDIKVEIVSQKDDSIVFKVPASTKPGRYSLMILTADGKQFLEQPVKLNIE